MLSATDGGERIQDLFQVCLLARVSGDMDALGSRTRVDLARESQSILLDTRSRAFRQCVEEHLAKSNSSNSILNFREDLH